jgi:hypothetical protein
MSISIPSVIISDDLGNQMELTPSSFVSGVPPTTQSLPFSALYNLDQALQALQPAPNATTVKFNDTILLDDLSGNTLSISIDASGNSVMTATDNITLTATTGVKLSSSTIIYTSSFFNTSQTLNNTSSYSNSFNGVSLTATLPIVNSDNVGSQYLITNAHPSPLTINSSGGQFIYSSFGTAITTTKSLNQGHSHIFTAINPTSAVAFGWSMV